MKKHRKKKEGKRRRRERKRIKSKERSRIISRGGITCLCSKDDGGERGRAESKSEGKV